MSAENQVQGVSLEHCKTSSPLCRGFWEYLNGVPLSEIKGISKDQRLQMKAYIQASQNGKTPYQISNETGLNKFVCSDLSRIKKMHRKAKFKKVKYESEKVIPVTDLDDLYEFIKSHGKVSTVECKSRFELSVTCMLKKLKRLEKAEKIKKTKEELTFYWEVTG